MATAGQASATSTSMSLDRTIGALFFATLLSMGLWGAGAIQLYFYFSKYRKDSMWLKVYVSFVWFLDTSHQGLLIGMLYAYTIAGFSDYQNLLRLNLFLVSSLLVGAVICAMVQSIFIMRIWRLSEKNLFVVIFTGSLVIAQFGSATMYFIRAIQSKTFPGLMSSMIFSRIANSVTAVADSAIAICLIILLHRTRSGFRESDTTINRLIMLTVNTGLITSLCALLGLILGFVEFETLFFMICYLMIPRLYTNCLLAALNSRNSMRRSFAKASIDTKASNRTTEVFKTATHATFLDNNPPPAYAVPREPGDLDTTATQASMMLNSGPDSPNSAASFYSRSIYSEDFEELQVISLEEVTPTKHQVNRSTDNWI